MLDTNTKNKPVVGIDLGTTYSLVAWVDAVGHPSTVINAEGDLTTPSVVFFDKNCVVVGKEAVQAAEFEPERIAQFAKRDMGRVSFHKSIRGEPLPPEVIQSLVLKKLKADAELKLGPIDEAVITVPAYFDEPRRKATQDAGRLAGLTVLDILNEPTAAAISYGIQQGFVRLDGSATPREVVLVYDLGGGTFDVTLMEIDGRKFNALATAGDVYLGGIDWTERIVDFIGERFMKEHQVDPRTDDCALQSLMQRAEDAKRALTAREDATIMFAFGEHRMRTTITREQFLSMTADLLERTISTTKRVLRDAKLEWKDVTRLLLVGGSSRMPAIAASLEKESGKTVDRSLSPDEAVAHGAAVYAALLAGNKTDGIRDIAVTNVNSHDLGILGVESSTGRNRRRIMIPRNTPLPCKSISKFTTFRDNQTSVLVNVIEGGDASGNNSTAIGKCIVSGLPDNLKAGTEVEVTFRYRANGLINVTAQVPSAGIEAKLEIERASGLDDEKLAYWKKRIDAGMSDKTLEKPPAPTPPDVSSEPVAPPAPAPIAAAVAASPTPTPTLAAQPEPLATTAAQISPLPQPPANSIAATQVTPIDRAAKTKSKDPRKPSRSEKKLDEVKQTPAATTSQSQAKSKDAKSKPAPVTAPLVMPNLVAPPIGSSKTTGQDSPIRDVVEASPAPSNPTSITITPTASAVSTATPAANATNQDATAPPLFETPGAAALVAASDSIAPPAEAADLIDDMFGDDRADDSAFDDELSTDPEDEADAAPPPPEIAVEEASPEWLAEEKKRVRMQTIKVMAINTFLHVVVLVILALIILPNNVLPQSMQIISSLTDDPTDPPLETPVLVQPDQIKNETKMEVVTDIITKTEDMFEINSNDFEPSMTKPETIADTGGANAPIGGEMAGRSKAGKSALVQKYGGTSESEAAVAAGLLWLKNHQKPDGSWQFDHRCPQCDATCSGHGSTQSSIGATSMALLAYMGAGNSYADGEHQETVVAALDFILLHAKPTQYGLDLRFDASGHSGMYTHGIASICLAEALAMNEMIIAKTPGRELRIGKKPRRQVVLDSVKLRAATQEAMRFICSAQSKTRGGWRYDAANDDSDTSVVGWQVIALKSAQASNIPIPPQTLKGVESYLNSVTTDGSQYGYADPSPRPSTSAIGLLCRIYSGWTKDTPGLKRGVELLSRGGPNPNNMYYNYYATQVMHQWGGDEWTKWNEVMRERLVKTQKKDGHGAGSWDLADPHGGAGGRLYMTCLATMTLEVYYRHLPIYESLDAKRK